MKKLIKLKCPSCNADLSIQDIQKLARDWNHMIK